MLRDEPLHYDEHARNQRGFAEPAVRKAGVVGRVDVARIRPCPENLGEDCQTAKTGVEHENGRRPDRHGCGGVHGSEEEVDTHPLAEAESSSHEFFCIGLRSRAERP